MFFNLSLFQNCVDGEESIMLSLQAQLKQAQTRIKTLESAIQHHQKYANSILTSNLIKF